MDEKELRRHHQNSPYRKTNDAKLGDVIKSLVGAYGLSHKLYEAQIKAEWDVIMGPTIAKYTDKISLRKKTLYLQINSASLKQELLYGKEKIMKAVNEHIGKDYIEHLVIW